MSARKKPPNVLTFGGLCTTYYSLRLLQRICIFSHPDFTVGIGITPIQPISIPYPALYNTKCYHSIPIANYMARGLSPPVGKRTLPRRIMKLFSYHTLPHNVIFGKIFQL